MFFFFNWHNWECKQERVRHYLTVHSWLKSRTTAFRNGQQKLLSSSRLEVRRGTCGGQGDPPCSVSVCLSLVKHLHFFFLCLVCLLLTLSDALTPLVLVKDPVSSWHAFPLKLWDLLFSLNSEAVFVKFLFLSCLSALAILSYENTC